jgi:hypothetical protein
MAIEIITQTPTRLTIHPEPSWSQDTSKGVDSGLSYTPSRAVRKPDVAEAAELSALDVLDLINPLQHIPFVSALYREVTGDTIRPDVKLAGSTVLGGVFGFVSTLADVIFEQETGKDIGATVFAALEGEEDAAKEQALAQNTEAETRNSVTALNTPALPANHPFALIGSNPYARMKQATEPSNNPQLGRLAAINPADHQILELYGNANPAAAAKAYQQTSMMNYLTSAR